MAGHSHIRMRPIRSSPPASLAAPKGVGEGEDLSRPRPRPSPRAIILFRGGPSNSIACDPDHTLLRSCRIVSPCPACPAPERGPRRAFGPVRSWRLRGRQSIGWSMSLPRSSNIRHAQDDWVTPPRLARSKPALAGETNAAEPREDAGRLSRESLRTRKPCRSPACRGLQMAERE